MPKTISPFLLGIQAFSCQILLLREFAARFYGNEVIFGLVLASWLLCGGLGSLWASRKTVRTTLIAPVSFLVIFLFPFCLMGLRVSHLFLNIPPGQITGMAPALGFALGLSVLISFPLGTLFVINSYLLQGRVSQVYLLEGAGAGASGLVLHFLLLPHLSNWQASTVLGLFLVIALILVFPDKRNRTMAVACGLALAALFFMDRPSQELFWQPFSLIETRDTPYGRLQTIRNEKQVSLYNNGLIVYSIPDPITSEDSIHFALLQVPHAEKVLLIGGGVGGGLRELLKYPQVEVDYVELDPEIIRMSLRILPGEERSPLLSDRVRIIYSDGRAYLTRATADYDVILLDLPEPSTALLNRFYTEEFFRIVHSHLKAGGIFSFRIPSSANYISKERRNFLASLHQTLNRIFPHINVVPGDVNIFLAGKNEIVLDPDELSRRISDLELQTLYVSPEFLYTRLDPRRVDTLRKALLSGSGEPNLDFHPISYLYTAILWNKEFRGLESRLLSSLAVKNRFWLLDFPLFLFVVLLLWLSFKKEKGPFPLLPLAVMGLTTITVEIIVIIAFQSLFGYIYREIVLLMTFFMLGLVAGAYRGIKRRSRTNLHVVLVQAGFVFLLAAARLLLTGHPPPPVFFGLLWCFGFLGGDLFVLSNSLYLEKKNFYGLGYGLDLLGSFLGALGVSSVLIPLFGLPALLNTIIVLNSLTLLFLVTGSRR